jgi:hypothetical protein
MVGFFGLLAAVDRSGAWFWMLVVLSPLVIMYGLIIIEIRFNFSRKMCGHCR